MAMSLCRPDGIDHFLSLSTLPDVRTVSGRPLSCNLSQVSSPSMRLSNLF